MSLTNPPQTRIPSKIANDPELREFFFKLTRDIYLIWEHLRKLESTTALTTITHTAPGTPDYAIQNLTNPGYGFVTQDEGLTTLKVIANLQTRINEIETHFSGG